MIATFEAREKGGGGGGLGVKSMPVIKRRMSHRTHRSPPQPRRRWGRCFRCVWGGQGWCRCQTGELQGGEGGQKAEIRGAALAEGGGLGEGLDVGGWTLTVLVDEHAEGDAAGEEAVQEVLHVAADEGVEAELLLVLDDPLGQGGNHVVVAVTDLDQELQEAAKS